ncbi:MAG: acyl-[ACP]--phospholipid O-acyltransferase [Alphaproteobacteria bacterium]
MDYRSQRFLPLFITQLLGAFNDNFYKNALLMLITYQLSGQSGIVAIASAVFILPFFLFSAFAGQLADKLDRALISRSVKLVEIAIMLLAIPAIFSGYLPLMLLVLFLLGVHSTFFGPVKYALLPQHLSPSELLPANAAMEAGMFLAILLGTIFGGLLILHSVLGIDGKILVCGILLLVAVAGYLSSRRIPAAPAPMPQLKLNRNIFAETIHIIQLARQNSRVFMAMLGISWFWLLGATYLSQFPPLVKNYLHTSPELVTIFLTLFSVGIAIGSMLGNKLLKGKATAQYSVVMLLLMAITGLDFAHMATHFPAVETGSTQSLFGFMANGQGLRMMLDLLLLAMSGGIYILPLYTIIQQDGDKSQAARLMAACNVLNASFMVLSSLVVVLLLLLGCSLPQILWLVAGSNIALILALVILMPHSTIRMVILGIFKLCYGLKIKGLEHYHQAKGPLLLVSNHVSYLDAALIAAALPDRITFAINTQVAKKWWIKPMLWVVEALPLDPTKPMAIKLLIDRLKQPQLGKKAPCMIFPEGRITTTGSLMKLYDGPGLVANRAGAQLLPIRIDGAQYTPFSHMKGKMRLRWFPRITLTIMPAMSLDLPTQVTGREKRLLAAHQLENIMTDAIFFSSNWQKPLFSSLIDAMQHHGGGAMIVEDVKREPLSYRQFFSRCFLLAHHWQQAWPPIQENKKQQPQHIGVLLPSSVASMVVFFALQQLHHIPAMLNFSTGLQPLLQAIKAADISDIISSRQFIETARLEKLIESLTQAGVNMIWLEDIKPTLTLGAKIRAGVAAFFPQLCYKPANAQQTAVLMFTSGSSGVPKVVALSHANIQANRFQIAARVDFNPQDKLFNCLPVFHSFGLMVGSLLPILSGIPVFFYPTPLHYRLIPEMLYDTGASILFGTDSFLGNYAKYAHPYDFHRLRYVFAGAERLKPETNNLLMEKFGVRVLEGYGTTETSPVLCLNTAMQHKKGSVGRLLPGISWQLQPVEGIEEGGVLHVKGPNIMQGYWHDGRIHPLQDGWYDTGDIVTIDSHGFITIKGRAKRFAKIAGEMVSLATIEEVLQAHWPNAQHAVLAMPHEKKGEQIILFTNAPEITRETLLQHYKNLGVSSLYLPEKILLLAHIPLLGSGKIDYQTLKSFWPPHTNT